MITKEALSQIIINLAKGSELNRFKVLGHSEEPMWQDPMVGLANGDDAYFKLWKQDIGDFHWSPAEAFALKYKEAALQDAELTVISIGFAQTLETMKDQMKAQGRPSLRWSVSRGEWEPFIQKLCTDLTTEMENYGIKSVAIDLLPEQGRRQSEKYGLASTWSHRHAAFVCGLGTFGLSDGLITRQGKAMRFSTIILEGHLAADPRPYTRYNEWCLYYAKGTCGACTKRCPVDAITKKGHDKSLCNAYLELLKNQISPEIKTDNTTFYYGCGLCQSRIPCQQGVPLKINEKGI